MPAESLDAFQLEDAAHSRRYRSIASPDSCGIEIYDIFSSPVRRWRRDEHAEYRSLSGSMRLPIFIVAGFVFRKGRSFWQKAESPSSICSIRKFDSIATGPLEISASSRARRTA